MLPNKRRRADLYRRLRFLLRCWLRSWMLLLQYLSRLRRLLRRGPLWLRCLEWLRIPNRLGRILCWLRKWLRRRLRRRWLSH